MNILQAAREVARSFPGGCAALGTLIKKNPTTFAHELNPPEGSLAKLGLVTAVAMTEAANDNRILHAWNQLRGFRAVRLTLPACDNAKDLNVAALEFSRDASEALACMHRVLSQCHYTENQVHTFEKDVSAIADAAATVAERMRMLAASQAKARALPRKTLPTITRKSMTFAAHATI